MQLLREVISNFRCIVLDSPAGWNSPIQSGGYIQYVFDPKILMLQLDGKQIAIREYRVPSHIEMV